MVTHRTKLKYVCNVFRYIMFMTPLPSCMSMWHFALLGKLLKPRVTFLGGCGVNSKTYVRTHEAAPVGLSSPFLRALGSSSTEFKWMPPERPNGVTTSHVTHRWAVCGWGMLVIPALQKHTHIPLCTGDGGASMFYGALAHEDWAGSCELWHTAQGPLCSLLWWSVWQLRPESPWFSSLWLLPKCCCLCFSFCPFFVSLFVCLFMFVQF